MAKQVLIKNPLLINKGSLIRLLMLVSSLIYGFFIYTALHWQYSVGSGDLGSYVFFFDQFQYGGEAPELSLRQDGAFRLAIFALRDLINQTTIDTLSYISFFMSSIIFYVFLTQIKSEKHFIYIFSILVMIFLSPSVHTLFSSNIRSGLAFTLLLIAFLNFKGFFRYVFLGLSILIHLSMLPFVALYFMYFVLNRFRSPYLFSFFALILAALAMTILGNQVHRIVPVSVSPLYNIMIIYLSILIIFLHRNIFQDVFGFMAIGLVLIYLAGLVFDISFIRYVGNSIVLYLLFLLRSGKKETIQIFSVAYIPFFIITTYFSLANNL
ncbi:MAG: hypothetical protein VW894_00050 [Gammaproteobacteria bacterium]